jgi:hypothetical protein
MYQNYALMQHSREASCIVNVASITTFLINSGAMPNKNVNGRVKAYGVWGTAHAYSLTEAFTEQGFQATPNIVDPNKNVRYIIPGHEAALEQAPNVVLSDLLVNAIDLSGFHAPDEGDISQLTDTLAANQQGDLLPFYIRAFQLNTSLDKHAYTWENATSDEEKADADYALRSDTHNLRNLLAELGINPDEYLVNPF